MALREKSLFTYGIQVTEFSNAIDFRASFGGQLLQATLKTGPYSLKQILLEVARAMIEVDPDNIYLVTADVSINNNTENRITINNSTGSFLEIYWATGPRSVSSAFVVLGFPFADSTGATQYTGTSTCGSTLIPEFVGYNYLGPDFFRKYEGIVSVAASGQKEGVMFSNQKYIQVEYKYEQQANVVVDWVPFWDWATQQKPFDFTPQYETNPTDSYSVTLESTSADGKGLGFQMKEMLPRFPFLYDSGMIKMRLTPSGN